MKRFKNLDGFTLFEVMISLAIVGGLLVTLIYTLNYHLAITDRQFVVTDLVNLASDKMREMRENPQNARGQFPDPYGKLSYETKVQQAPFSLTEMSEITVIVQGGKERIVLSELIRTPRATL